MATLKTNDIKTYRKISNAHWTYHKNHTLVRAAYRQGLTGVIITRGMGKGAERTGWTLECDQVPKLHLGYEIKEAEARINKISI